MALLGIANLTLHLGQRQLLDGVNLTLDAGEHVGLVGRNGCGKSTLMKLIANLDGLKPDQGQIQLSRSATAGYLRQDPDLNLDHTLRQEAATAFDRLYAMLAQIEQLAHDMADATGEDLEKLLKQYEKLEHQIEAAGGYSVDHLIDETLHGLGLTDEYFDVKVTDLSGGQKGRLALAKLLLSSPDLLLLDEPTNHLDIAGRQWLETFLDTYRGAVILISHDRWLLNRTVKKIYELEAGRLVEYPGNYEKYRELRVERRIAQQRVYEKQQTKIKAEQAFIERYRAGQRARQALGREKRLERFLEGELVERPLNQQDMNLQLRPLTRSGDRVAAADHLTQRYDDLTLFDDLNLEIKRGDRIGIIGPNGAGKSTLVRCLLGEQQPTAGQVRHGSQIHVGHYRQTHEHLNLQLTVVEYLRDFVASQTEQEARDLAGAFLFTGIEQDKVLGSLSGGERSRTVLAGLMAGGHNVLVLDEPTNHLDIFSAERLEEALRQFTTPPSTYGQTRGAEGTLLLITHDRMLLENIVDQLLIFDGEGHVRLFPGTYSDYLEEQRKAAAAASAPPPAPKAQQPKREAKAQTGNGNGNARQGNGKSKSTGGGGRFKQMSQSKLEARIEEVEKRLAALDAELADPDNYRDGEKIRRLQAEVDTLRSELGPLEAEWESRAE